MRLYSELAAWFPLVTPPADYRREAAWYRRVFRAHAQGTSRSVLELGSGGGHNASHLRRHFKLTLVDRSAPMLRGSRRLNPGCEHLRGDMRTARLGREFDVVFVHDAVSHLLTARDLLRTMATAFLHCRPGGAAVFAPDCTRETFEPGTDRGGVDAQGRGVRYLEWRWDPDPADTTHLSATAYILRDGRVVRTAGDVIRLGLFPRRTWMDLLRRAGFRARRLRAPWDQDVFVGRRRFRTDLDR